MKECATEDFKGKGIEISTHSVPGVETTESSHQKKDNAEPRDPLTKRSHSQGITHKLGERTGMREETEMTRKYHLLWKSKNH